MLNSLVASINAFTLSLCCIQPTVILLFCEKKTILEKHKITEYHWRPMLNYIDKLHERENLC